VKVDIEKVRDVIRFALKKTLEVRRAFEKYEEPYCEITQNEKGIKIAVKLPSVKKRTIMLQANGKKIEVKGSSERKNFYKSIDIPPLVDITKAHASLTNDTLKLTLPYSRAL
jgi:HSP20 family molecular chaperone IbpA